VPSASSLLPAVEVIWLSTEVGDKPAGVWLQAATTLFYISSNGNLIQKTQPPVEQAYVDRAGSLLFLSPHPNS
jgi:hypothetical protein